MADETETPTEGAEEPKVAGKAGGKAKMLPLVGGIAVGLALGAGVGMLVLGPKLSASPAPGSAVTAAADGKKDGHATREGEAKKAETLPIYQMDNLVLNPAGSGGSHFLLLSVALEVKDAGTADLLKTRDAEMRDAVLRMFGEKTVEQVSEASARDQLRAELLEKLSKALPAGAIHKIYFPQFVIQ